TLGSFRVSTEAFASTSRIGLGVPVRARKPNQLVKSKSSKPGVSESAGVPANAGNRFLLVTAIAFRLPAFINGTTGGMPEIVSLTCPLTASDTAGAAPRYGT